MSTKVDSHRRDRLLPLELLAISLALGVFTGLIVVVATRQFLLAGIALGVAFIVSIVVLALFALAFKPTDAEVADIHRQDAQSEAGTLPSTDASTGPADDDQLPRETH